MLQKKFRLRKKSDFSRVFSGQLSYASKFAVIYILKGRPLKFGFVASKKSEMPLREIEQRDC
jgi:RNase P protein component